LVDFKEIITVYTRDYHWTVSSQKQTYSKSSYTISSYFTFMLPCIVRVFLITNQMH